MPAAEKKFTDKKITLPRPVVRALRNLGKDISIARRMRRWSQQDLALRIDASLSTVRRMEDGYPGTALHTFLRTLQVLGRLDAMLKVLALENDELGIELVREQLPQRVRSRSGKYRRSDSVTTKVKDKVNPNPDVMEGF